MRFDEDLVHHPECDGLPGCLDTCPVTWEEWQLYVSGRSIV
jgi:hypothetical protein